MAKLTTTDVYGKLTAHSNSAFNNNVDFNGTFTMNSVDINGNPVSSVFSWNALDGTINTTFPNNVVGQMFQENYIYAQAIEPISNGQAVMFAGSNGTHIHIRVANTTIIGYQPEWIVGIATQDFANNEFGYVTCFGKVNEFQTLPTWNEGDILYLDPYNPGMLMNTLPDAHNYKTQLAAITSLATSTTSKDGTILVRPFLRMSNIQTVTKDPTGFDSPENIIINYDSVARTITLTGSFVGGFWQGNPVQGLISGWVSPPHPVGITTPYFLYYDGSNYVWSTAVWPFYGLMIAYVYADSGGPRFALRECHGTIPWQAHFEFHQTIGTYMPSNGGGDLSNYTLNSTTLRRPTVSITQVRDEDILTVNAASSGTYYTIFYLSSTGLPNWLNNTDIVPLSGTQPYWNQFTTTWNQSLMSNNSYMSIWLFAIPTTADTNSQKYRYIWVQGQSNTSDLASQQALSPSSLNLTVFGGAILEYVAIDKIIIRYTGGNWTIVEVDKLTGTKIVQTSASAGNYLSTVASNWPLNGLGTPTSPLNSNQLGTVIASASSITPTSSVFHISGTTQINTITMSYSSFVGPIYIIPDGVFTTGTSGNIALASTAVVNKVLIMVYDNNTSKWYPSY